MPATSSTASQSAPVSRRRGWLVVASLLGWTVLAGGAIGWLASDAANATDTVIRVGQDDVKSWTTRLHENVAVARLNFPWALAWLFLAPYVLWIGVRFSFEGSRWRSRLPVLLATGVAFVWCAQWLAKHVGSGEATIIMVKY